MKFSWDELKNETNYEKHGVWFEEAATIFTDKNALEVFDVKNSESEERYILIGFSTAGRLLVAIYTELSASTIRIISSRKAKKKEIGQYEKRI